MYVPKCTQTHIPVLNGPFQLSHQFYSKFCAARNVRPGSVSDGFFVNFWKIKDMNLQNNVSNPHQILHS